MPRSAVEAPQQLDWTSCSNHLADLVPCRYPVRSKKSLTKRANFSATLLQMHSHCKTCWNPLHADEIHAECVSRLGKSHAALSGAECLHCECFRLASLRSRIASFSESDSAPHALSFSSSQGSVRIKQRSENLSGRCQASSCHLKACVPRRHRRGREHSPILFTQHDQHPSSVSDMISLGMRDGEIDERLFSGGFGFIRLFD